MSKFLGVNFIVDSSAAFLRNTTFNSSTYLHGNTFISNPALATGGTYNALVTTTVGTDALIKYITLGTMAFEASTNYVQVSAFNSSMGILSNINASQDASINAINASVGSLDASMNKAFTFISIHEASLGRLDASINALYNEDSGTDASIIRIDASINKLFAKINSTDASILNINSSLGLLNGWQITQDASIVDIRNLVYSSGRGAGNGLQILADGSVGLGGTLRQNTYVDASRYTLELGKNQASHGVKIYLHQDSSTAKLEFLNLASNNYAIADNTGARLLSTGSRDAEVITHTSGYVQLYATDFVNSARVTLDGSSLVYGGDYSSKFVDRSLIDKGYLVSYVNTNASFGAIDASLTKLFQQNINQDSSIAGLDLLTQRHEASLGRIDASVNKIFSLIGNVSIGGLDASVGRLDGSVNKLFTTTSNLNSSLGLFVLKSGDVMTGGLAINSGGLNVTNDVSVFGNLYVNSNAFFTGNLIINGSFIATNTDVLNVSIGYIFLNSGLVGPPPSNLQSGIIVNRGTLDSYAFIFSEFSQTFRIGLTNDDASTGHYLDASTQAVATRQDNPLNRGLAWWDPSTFMFKTAVLQAGSGVTITQTDTSILIGVTGAAAYVKKYTTTFNGTIYDSSTITAATHGCGTGPFTVSVYDNNVLVYPDVAQNGSGDVTISWATGSISSSGALIITG